MANPNTHKQLVGFIWSICNLLRGPYKRNEYRKVILPLTVLRRFDCLLAPTKAQVLAEHAEDQEPSPRASSAACSRRSPDARSTTSRKLDFAKLLDDPNQLAPNLNAYINGFSKNVRDIMERFAFDQQIARMDEKNLLYEVIKAFARVDLSPERVDNIQMGYVFEELIRIGAEQSNEEAGEHFTPREVIKLMVNLLLSPEKDLRKSHVVKTIYDPACGTGGMLSVAEKYIRDLNAEANPHLFGQDWNDEAWAVCKSDMLIKGEDADNIILGDTFTKDGFDRDAEGKKITFDYMLANPPFGVEWKQQQRFIEKEHEDARLQRPLRRRPAAHQRRLAALPAAHALEDARAEGRRQPHRHRLQRLAALHRRRRQRREQHPPLDHRERLAGGHRRAARPALLQHRHLDLHLGAHQPQGAQPQGQGAAHRRARILREDEEEPRQQAQQDRRPGRGRAGPDRRHHPHLRQTSGTARRVHLHRERSATGQDASVVSKVFDNDDFGFHKITVERPLRLNFQASAERIARLEDESGFKKLATSNKKNETARQKRSRPGSAGRSRSATLLARLRGS